MQKAILQVPLSKGLRDNAEKEALSQGFSSLQELVRVFLAKLTQKKIEVSIQESMPLSKRSEERYVDMTHDFESKKNIYTADSVDNLLIKLNENSLS